MVKPKPLDPFEDVPEPPTEVGSKLGSKSRHAASEKSGSDGNGSTVVGKLGICFCVRAIPLSLFCIL